MQRERVSENVYWFQSDVYAQVTAGVVAGPQWAVVIDTLAMPEETLAMRDFIEDELSVPVRYIINTHSHADHCWGNCFFPGATIISHSLTRQLMGEKGVLALESAKKQNQAFRQVKIVLPQMTFDQGALSIRVGKKSLVLFPTPGHSIDGISVLVEEDRVLFAGDAFLPIPYVVDGNIDELTASIKRIGKMGLENIIQGHGDIILRGEIEDSVRENLSYLAVIRKSIRNAARKRNPLEALDHISIESCGKSRVYLGGLAEELHRRNIRVLYRRMVKDGQVPPPPEIDPDEDYDYDEVDDIDEEEYSSNEYEENSSELVVKRDEFNDPDDLDFEEDDFDSEDDNLDNDNENDE